MFENKFVSLPSHLKTIEPMEVHRESRTMCNTETSKVISRTDPMISFKAVLSPFKKTPSASWNENTVKDANTGREYRDFANYVRSQFVDIDANGKIMDKQEFLKLGSDGKPMYIGHDLRRNS